MLNYYLGIRSIKRRIRDETGVQPELKELLKLVEKLAKDTTDEDLWAKLREKRKHYEGKGSEFFPGDVTEAVSALIDSRMGTGRSNELFATALETYNMQGDLEEAFEWVYEMIDLYKN